MVIKKDLQKLLDAGVIDQSTADSIASYYQHRERDSSSMLLVIFAVLGALLIGLGIILILAHNWDMLPRSVKTILSFLPLVVGQLLCGYALLKKADSKTWREATAVFLVLAVGASIALVSQVYHLEGKLSSFLLTWLLLALPIIYVMRATMAAVLCVLGTITYAGMWMEQGSWQQFAISLGLLGLVVPHYIYEMRANWLANALSFLHYLIPVSFLYCLGILADSHAVYGMPMFMNAFAILYLLGNTTSMRRMSLRSNGYVIIGGLGSIVLLLIHSFGYVWDNIHRDGRLLEGLGGVSSIGFFLTLLLALLGLAYHIWSRTYSRDTPLMPVFLVFILLHLAGATYPSAATLLTNIVVAVLAVLSIMAGARRDNLGILNYGLLIMTALLICRFFDVNIPFVIRGILFILVGVAFFVANSLIIKKRRIHAQ